LYKDVKFLFKKRLEKQASLPLQMLRSLNAIFAVKNYSAEKLNNFAENVVAK
jgi:hypothetical protein